MQRRHRQPVSAANRANPGSDAQPSPGQCNLGCNLHTDSAAFTRTGHLLSVPVEGCERLPGLPGVRKVSPDSLTRRCSDQGCNFGTRAGLNSAAIPALRALYTADTGSPFAKKPGVRNIRRKVRPDIATFARSRHPLSRPVEDCKGCRALAGVRNVGLDDPRAGRPDSHCNFGDRSIRACRATAATQRKSRKRAVLAPRHCSAPTSRPGQIPLM